MRDQRSQDKPADCLSGSHRAADFHAMDWFGNPVLRDLLTVLNADGACTRIVGGAVRNALLGRPVNDVDLATTLLPEQTKAAAAAAGFKTVDTGLSHGTITAIRQVDGAFQAVEVTTLRHDVETFGRHAKVAFTDDWSADAARRDFTMNAIYVDQQGELFDPVGGVCDLETRTVRFVGDPDDRIEEDFLRILRFFRFSAQYGNGILEPAGLAACVRKRAGLASLSAERIRKELFSLLVAPFACDVLRAMESYGLLSDILGTVVSVDVLCRLAMIEEHQGYDVDQVRRLGALVPLTSLDQRGLKKRLRLSNSQSEALAAAAKTAGILRPPAGIADVTAALYSHGRRPVLDGVLIDWSKSDVRENDDVWIDLCARISNQPVPEFPLGGRDLVDRGVPEGPQVGRALRRLEAYWLQRDCIPGKVELLQQL